MAEAIAFFVLIVSLWPKDMIADYAFNHYILGNFNLRIGKIPKNIDTLLYNTPKDSIIVGEYYEVDKNNYEERKTVESVLVSFEKDEEENLIIKDVKVNFCFK